MMMKNIAVVLVVIFVISAHHMVTVVESSAFDCLDACITGCAAQYINNGRLRQRCEGKCSIKCNPGDASQVHENPV
ncbi:hypothetical protein AB3S75_013010 [Citrus x aurantiifolia]